MAYWGADRILENLEWDLAGTPCDDVVRGNLCHHPTGVRLKFPADTALVKLGIESYLGVPLLRPTESTWDTWPSSIRDRCPRCRASC